MALREAAIRLTLQSGGFIGGLQGITRQVQAAGAKMQAALSSSLKAGMAGARTGFGGLKNDITGVLKTAASLGGVFAAGAAARKGIQMQEVFSNLAFELSVATGKAVSWQEVQKQIEPVALATSRSTEELARAFKAVKDETGDIELAKASIGAIGTLATASGKSVDELAAIAGAMNDKFGVTAAEMPDMLAAMVEMSNRGGVGFEDMTKAVHLMGASARAAGMSGAEGVRRMIALANIGGDALGNTRKGLMAITQLVDRMADPAVGAELKKTFSVDVKDKGGNLRDTTDILSDIMAKSGGKREELGKVFKGEELKLVTEVGKYFVKGYEGASGTEKDRVRAGTEAFRKALDNAGKTTFDFAAASEDAARRAEEPQRKLAQAMELFAQEFTKPEMLSALNELAKTLPKLAGAMAKLVSFTVNHPVLAAGAYAGLRVGAPAASGAMMSLGQSGLKAAGSTLATMFAAEVAKNGKWGAIGKTIGATAGVALAAYVAYELGKSAIDESLDKDQNLLSRLNIAAEHAADVAADPKASRAQKEAALVELRAAKDAKAKEGMSVATAVFGGAAAAITGDESLDPSVIGAKATSRANQMIEVLGGQLGDTSQEAKRAAMSFRIITEEANNAAKALKGVKPGGGGGNGLPKPPGNEPGHG